MAPPSQAPNLPKAGNQSGPIANSQSIRDIPPSPAPPPPPFEYLLELCLDLQVGAISPDSFASTLGSSPSLIPPLKCLLPLLLSTDQFSLSAPLAKAILLLADEKFTSFLSYQPASLALAAFLFSLTDPYIPSPELRTLRKNAHYATNILHWPYVRSVVAIHSCLQASEVANRTIVVTKLNSIEEPPSWFVDFDKWWSMLSSLQHAADHILQRIQTVMKDGYESGLFERIRFLNDSFQETLLSSLGASRGDREDVQKNTETAERRHILLFLLTEKVLRGVDNVNWPVVSMAYAYLYMACAAKPDYDAWWASVASTVARVAKAKLSTLAGAMLVVPFLSPVLPSSGEPLSLLLHLLTGIEGHIALYGALSLSCRAEFHRRDDEFKFQFVSAILFLPSVAFQDVAASLES